MIVKEMYAWISFSLVNFGSLLFMLDNVIDFVFFSTQPFSLTSLLPNKPFFFMFFYLRVGETQ